MNQFTESYWTHRYKQNDAGWDAGSITTPLKEYIDQLTDKTISILIPGAGNGYEAEYLWDNGFKNVTVMDISPEPIQNIKKRIPSFPPKQLLTADFFEHTGNYDLIIEQTFFCALDPSLQSAYVAQMNKLLKHGGKLVGLLFTEPLHTTSPPFALTKENYMQLFHTHFKIQTLETCYNSIKPRKGRELFMILQKD